MPSTQEVHKKYWRGWLHLYWAKRIIMYITNDSMSWTNKTNSEMAKNYYHYKHSSFLEGKITPNWKKSQGSQSHFSELIARMQWLTALYINQPWWHPHETNGQGVSLAPYGGWSRPNVERKWLAWCPWEVRGGTEIRTHKLLLSVQPTHSPLLQSQAQPQILSEKLVLPCHCRQHRRSGCWGLKREGSQAKMPTSPRKERNTYIFKPQSLFLKCPSQ